MLAVLTKYTLFVCVFAHPHTRHSPHSATLAKFNFMNRHAKIVFLHCGRPSNQELQEGKKKKQRYTDPHRAVSFFPLQIWVVHCSQRGIVCVFSMPHRNSKEALRVEILTATHYCGNKLQHTATHRHTMQHTTHTATCGIHHTP